MAYEYHKITQEDTQGKGVTGLPDTPGLSAGEMQEKFDELANVIIEKHNEFIDELNEHGGNSIQSEDVTNIQISRDNTIQVSNDGGETFHDTASSGHTIMNGSGISFEQRSRMQFSDNVVITDDPANGRTFISVPQGTKGDKGDAATISIGTVIEGESAGVTNSGSVNDAIFNFTLPKGDTGTAATIQVGTVTKGDNPSVSNRGTSSSAIFDFVLPKGDKGDVGQGINILGEYANLAALQAAHPTGNAGNAYMVGSTNPKDVYIWDVGTNAWKNQGALQGAKGDTGEAATITIGEVSEGEEFAVENVGTSEEAILNFTLVKGEKGDTGGTGTIAVGTVTSGQTASVTNVGTSTAAVFDFVIPPGPQGEQGDPTTVNSKSGASITLYGSDIVVDGYEKADAEIAIEETDTINEALGKLEFKADSAGKNDTMTLADYEALSPAQKMNHTLRIITDVNNRDEGNVADTFDATKSYSKGAIVIYNNVTYEANQNVTAGSFDGTQWDAKTIGNVVETTNANLTQLETRFDGRFATLTGTMPASSGQIIANYPQGFTQNGCVIVSAEYYNNSNHYPITRYASNTDYAHVYRGTVGIALSASTGFTGYSKLFKIVLLKLDI